MAKHICDNARRDTHTVRVGAEHITYEDTRCSGCGAVRNRRVINRESK